MYAQYIPGIMQIVRVCFIVALDRLIVPIIW